MWQFTSITILLVSIFFLNSLFRHEGKTAFILSTMIIGFAEIVIISEIASLFHQITPLFYLISHVILAGISGIVWRTAGKPPLLGPFSDDEWKIWLKIPPFKSHIGLYILASGVLLVFLSCIGLILILPQNNHDSMTYHLSRVAYWMQHQTLAHWATPNPRQTISPVNAELGLLWTMLLSGSDTLTGFVQWFSAVGIGIAIFGLARLLGASRSQGAFSTLIWISFPHIILQSTTTQNDLVAAFAFVSMLYFLFLGLRNKNNGALYLSGAALGLALGTKVTFFFLMPGFIISLILIWKIVGRTGFRYMLIWGAAGIIGIGLFGVFNYLQNLINYGNPLTIPEWTTYAAFPASNSYYFERGIINLVIYFTEFFDFTGLPMGLVDFLIETKTFLLKSVLMFSGAELQLPDTYSISTFSSFQRFVHEDSTLFGPLSILLLPLTIIQFYRGIRKKDYVRLGLAITAVGFYLTLGLLLNWTPFRARYFVLTVSILAPFLAFVYRPGKLKVLYIIVSTLAIWVMGYAQLNNVSRPLIGPNLIWGKEWIDIRMSRNPEMIPVLDMANEFVPTDGVLATELGGDHWDYVLFGKDFERTIIPMDPRYPGIDQEFLNSSGADYVLFSPRERPFLNAPEGLIWIDEKSGWYLFRVSEEAESNLPPEVDERLLSLSDEEGLLVVDRKLAGKVGLTELYSPAWRVETFNGTAFKWLGEGRIQGLQAYLWSETEIPVRVIFNLQPGPSREDNERNLQVGAYPFDVFGHEYEKGIYDNFIIDSQENYEFIIPLRHGFSSFSIFSLDQATISELPNGDKRPLLVLLNHIDVLPMENMPEIFSVHDSFKDTILISEQYLADWGLEFNGEQPIQWLGEGIEQGFRSYIWSEKEVTVRLVFHLTPGPSRDDSERFLRVNFARYGYFEEILPIDHFIFFDQPIQDIFDVKLHKGMNIMEIKVLDEANIDVLPNGDTRPLLVQLQKIELLPIDE